MAKLSGYGSFACAEPASVASVTLIAEVPHQSAAAKLLGLTQFSASGCVCRSASKAVLVRFLQLARRRDKAVANNLNWPIA
jgi:hypothetical protein